jgi:hypothetical protein
MIINNCPICCSLDLIPKKNGNAILFECRSCGIIFLKDMPSEYQVLSYYQEIYHITSEDIIQTEKRRVSRLPEQFFLISQIRKYFNKLVKILDIGCDKGAFLDEARRYGHISVGVEPSVSARSYCRKIGLNVVPSIDDVDQSFEIVIMSHSLEHHLNPKETLNKLKSKMTRDSIIIIRVPAFDSFWSKLLKHKWIWFQPDNHYYHFSIKSLTNLLKISGFELIEMEHRRPNNKYTIKMSSLTNHIFNKYFNNHFNFRQYLSQYYQYVTGIEIFAIAKKGENILE